VTTIDLHTAEGTTDGTVELPAEIFDVTANIPLIHQVVVAQLAAARQGTHSTKTRGDVRGGGKKPYRQKGTGRARQGSTRSPQFAGGGIAHGPQPHGYAQRTPKKMIAAALRGALSDRARDGRIYVVADLVPGDVPSTKTALSALSRITSTDKVLVVIHRDEDLVWLSLRNSPSVHAIAVDQLNAYDVLVNDEVVFTSTALSAYIAGPKSGRSAKAVATESEAELLTEPTNAELAADLPTEPTNAELATETVDLTTETVRLAEPVEEPELVEAVEEPDELASASVEESVEPTSEELAASAESAESFAAPSPRRAAPEPDEAPADEAETEPVRADDEEDDK
jgi:large subunit ribosomal protein L4